MTDLWGPLHTPRFVLWLLTSLRSQHTGNPWGSAESHLQAAYACLLELWFSGTRASWRISLIEREVGLQVICN